MVAPRPPHHRVPLARRSIALGLILAVVLWLIAPGIASAHAHLVQADPAPDSVIAHAPSVAEFLFDEPLNPALTRVRVMTAAGRQVTTDTGHLASGHNGELWQLALPSLPAGTYSVFWTSESATDGHVISSFYTFRVAPSGGSSSFGAVTGQAQGVYGGGASAGSSAILNGGVAATALFTWLGLAAQALWLGALLVELTVLAPARRAAETPEARLAWAATPRLWWVVRGAPVVAVWALLAEVLSLALVGTSGDWAQALAPATIGGILSSQNGRFILLRLAVLLVALVLAGRVVAPASAAAPERPQQRARRAPQALGITATMPALAAPGWETMRGLLVALSALYMLLVAFSGHAADVTPGWLSYPIDWLHLLFTAAWAGGIAALAFGVLPLRRKLPPEERAPAVLPLLDRFSPLAYAAVGVLALSGLYNAVNHLASPSVLVNATYGQLLLLKIGLVGVLIVLSASHVWGLRRRIARAQLRADRDHSAMAAVHEGLATLAARIRLESGVGAAILLATALMGQTLPPNSTPAAAGVAAIPASISGESAAGDLRGRLTVAPPAVGASTFTLRLWEKNAPITAGTGAAIIHLFPAAQPNLRANLTPGAQGAQFVAHGSLAETGTWRADVLVRTVALNEYRTLPFTFTAGPGATFLAPGLNPEAVGVAITPGLISDINTVTIAGVQAPAVRLLSQSLDMYMGILPYAATPLGGGRWRVGGVFPPMNGRWGLTVQVQKDGTWISLRQFVYWVPLSGPMHLLSGLAATSGAITPSSQPGGTNAPYNVSFARTLPYTAVVTQMGSNGVRLLGKPLLKTGLQAHGVDVLDGTPYAYVTNFGAEPGTVSQIDMSTMRVVRTFTVGLGPAHIVFTPDHRRAFVTDFRSSDLYVLDLVSGATRRIAFPDANPCFAPHGIDISEDGHTLFVACAGFAWIYTVDTRTLQPGHVAVTGRGPIGVAVNAPRHEVWVTNQTDNTVTVLDERTLRTLATIKVGKGPALLVPTPDGRTVYVADQFGNAVSVIDAATRRVTDVIAVASQPHGLDVTADGKYVYVASIGGNVVTIIRTADNHVVAVVPSPLGSNEVAIAH